MTEPVSNTVRRPGSVTVVVVLTIILGNSHSSGCPLPTSPRRRREPCIECHWRGSSDLRHPVLNLRHRYDRGWSRTTQRLPVRSNTGDDLDGDRHSRRHRQPDLVPEQSDTDIRHYHDHRVSGRPGAAVQPQGERILRQHSLSCARRPYAVRSRISLTRSIVVCGCKNAKRPTVSPSHLVGGMKAICSSCNACAHAS